MYQIKEIKHAQDRADALRHWLATHSYDHPECEAYMRDLRQTELKLAKMNQPRPMQTKEEFHIPTNRKQ